MNERNINSLYYVLSNNRLLNGHGGELTPQELLKFWEFYNMFDGFIASPRVNFIMRGESDDNLNSQYNVDTNNPVELAGRLFMTGEKARLFWIKNKFIDPDDTSNDNFRRICESLCFAIHNGEQGKSKRAERIRTYCSNNAEFCKALENIPSIVEAYSGLGNCEKQTANLQYLSIIHTINSRKYKSRSGFVSTTTDIKVADKFANDCIIYGWIPKSLKLFTTGRARAIGYIDSQNSATLKQLGLPYPNSPVYPEQNEISVRCGLLPHFIIGFTAGESFYVNPAIFSAIDKMHGLTTFQSLSDYKRELQFGGLEVNQEGFEDFLHQTNFKRYFTVDGDVYMVHQV